MTELPSRWVEASLSDVCVEKVEQISPSTDQVPYIDISSIDRATKTIGETQFVTQVDAPTRARQRVEHGDVLVSMTRPNLNAVAKVDATLDGAIASTGFDVLRPLGVLADWIFYRVRSQAFIADVCQGLQGVVYPAIRPHDVRRHRLPVPPIDEQHRIVEAIESYFTRLDDAMATLERVQRNLKRYRASVLKAAVEGRLVPTAAELARAEGRDYEPATDVAFADRSDLPIGWTQVLADTVCGAIVSGSTPTADKLSSGEGEIPFIKVYNLTMTGELDFTVKPTYVSRHTHGGQLARSRVYPGDVLTNIVGPPLGKVSVVTVEHPEWNINQAIAAFRPSPRITTGWLRLVLMSEPAQRWLLGTSKTTTSQVNLAISNCRRLPVPLPPLTEQVSIVAEADRLLSVAAETEADAARQLLKLRHLRQSILKWAFEGRLVDQDPSDEPASALLERIKAERAAATTTPNKKPRRKGNSANA